MPDYPSAQGYTTSQLKAAFDAPAEGLQTDVNGLMTELEDTTAAENIGADEIVAGDTSDANVQAKLEKLYTDMQGITQGAVSDGSITSAKLDATYEATLAKKDGTLQTGLSSEKLNGKTEAQLKSAFLTTLSPTNVTVTALAKNTATTTQTETVATSGCRYYILANSYYKVTLYDAKSQKFVFSIPTSDNSYYKHDYAYNTASIRLYGDTGTSPIITLTATYAGTTLTLNVTKSTTSNSGTPSGTITVFELGGIV